MVAIHPGLGGTSKFNLNSALRTVPFPTPGKSLPLLGPLEGPTNNFVRLQSPQVCFAQAQFDFSAQDPSQLSFRRGDIIEVVEHLDPHWWRGRFCGHVGFFPRSYVQPVHL